MFRRQCPLAVFYLCLGVPPCMLDPHLKQRAPGDREVTAVFERLWLW